MELSLHIYKYEDIYEMVNEEGADESSLLRGGEDRRKLPTGGSTLELDPPCPRTAERAPTKHPR